MSAFGGSSRPRRGLRLLLLAILWALALAVSVLLGSHSLDLSEAVRGFGGTGQETTILFSLRLPRALLALAAGGILAGAGLTFQTMFRNALAEPYTLGVASGAALGAVVAIRLGAGELGGGLPAVGLGAFLGALAAALVVVSLAQRAGARPGGLDNSSLLLAGVAVSLACGALILVIQFLAEPYQTFRMVRWTMGGLAVVGYREVLWLAPWCLLGLAVLLSHRWELNLLLTGDELAASRGVDIARTRVRLIGWTSLLVGATVAVTGPIGFVGLMVPHALRRAFGPDHGWFLPACFLGGGAFLTLCDLLARTLAAPAELPVGVLTALLGGPFFLLLLLARRPHR